MYLIAFIHSVRRFLVTVNVVPSAPILVTLSMEALRSSETSVRNIQEGGIFHSYCRENLNSYKKLNAWIYIFSRGQQSFSCWSTSLCYTEADSSLLRSQEPVTLPYQIQMIPTYIIRFIFIYYYIRLSRSTFHSFRPRGLFHKNTLCSLLRYTFYVSCPSRHPWFYHSNYIYGNRPLLIPSALNLFFIVRYLNFATFSKELSATVTSWS
jgi:hypothetical protein